MSFDVSFFKTMKLSNSDRINENIAQKVSVSAQLSKKTDKTLFSWSLRKSPVISPLTPIGKKKIRVPLVNSKIAKASPIINQIFPVYKSTSSIRFFILANAT